MAWQAKAAEVAAAYLKNKNKQNGGNGGIAAIVMIAIMLSLPVLILVALFSGGNGNSDMDIYEVAFNSTGCDNWYYYQTEDIRFFDQYTYPDGVEPESSEKIKERMEQDYFNISQPQGSNDPTDPTNPTATNTRGKTCILKSDEEIIATLNDKYNVDEGLNNEITETIQQVRNGRQGFQLPVESPATVALNYNGHASMNGVEFKAEKDSEVKVIGDGEIIDIITSDDYYYGVDKEGEAISKKEGLTVVVKHEVQRGINKFGDYDNTTMYSRYTNLKDVKKGVGDTLEQGEVIGKNKNKNVYLELWDTNKKVVDPNLYMFIASALSSENLGLPAELPFTITWEAGPRELDDNHYGIDIDKGYGESLYSISDGVVVSASNTCSPDVGGTKCPESGDVPWGGNYVVIKSTIDGVEYYIQYAHLTKTTLKVDDKVYIGQTVGFQGNSGNSSGTHLHIGTIRFHISH